MTLTATQLEVRYGPRVALRPTTLDLAPGSVIGLIGPNGAGKSSLLRALAGLGAHAGRVEWCGRDLARLRPQQRAMIAAYLPQAPAVHWPMRVRELVALGRLPHRHHGRPASPADEAAVAWAMEQAELPAFADRSADELSIGERARVLLARALAVRAPVLLVDEPIAMLDPYHQLQIMAVLRNYATASLPPITGPRPVEQTSGSRPLVVAVLHDLALAARFCDRVLLIDRGMVAADGHPTAVLSAETLRRHYRIEPLIAHHDGEPLIVPWRRLNG